MVGKHYGTKVCLRRKKTKFKTKLNINDSSVQIRPAVVTEISLARRQKTFAGLLQHSNGAINCIPLFNGATIGHVVKIIAYLKNPKIHFFTKFETGYYTPIAYLSIMTCFFNIKDSQKKTV
jgi:hypothetical protein